MTVIALYYIDLLHGYRVEADREFQLPNAVKQGDSYRHDVFVNMIDGLGRRDLFLLTDHLRRYAGGKGPVRLQLKGRTPDY